MYRRFVAAGDYFDWRNGLRKTHRRETSVHVLDLDHRFVGTLPPVVDGQRTIDVTVTPTREVNLTILDPRRTITWEPDGATDFTYLRRMLQVWDRRLVDGIGWVGCPIFTGPLSDVGREGAEVNLVAEGKERLAMGNVPRNLSWGRKQVAVEVIFELLVMSGEDPSRIHLPPLKTRLPEALNVTSLIGPITQNPITGGPRLVGPLTSGGPTPPTLTAGQRQTFWGVAQRLARSLDYYLFYDGLGHVRMRRVSMNVVETLGPDVLMSAPISNGDVPEVRNKWVVLGPKPKGDKARVGAEAWLPDRHDMSSWSLRRGGKRRWLVDHTVESQLKSNAKAEQIALRKRDEQMRVTQELAANLIPIPNFEEYDLIRVIDPETGERPHIRLKKETLPLVSGEQTLGVSRRVSAARGKGSSRRRKSPWGYFGRPGNNLVRGG